MLLIYRFMPPHATDTLFPIQRTLAPSNPCRNGSTCVAQRDDDDYKCTCTPGFKGKNCRKAIDIQVLSRSQRITITTNLEFSERFDEEQTFKLSALEILYGDKFASFYTKTRRIIFATYTQI